MSNQLEALQERLTSPKKGSSASRCPSGLNYNSSLRFQSAGLPCRFSTCLVHFHNHMSQLLNKNTGFLNVLFLWRPPIQPATTAYYHPNHLGFRKKQKEAKTLALSELRILAICLRTVWGRFLHTVLRSWY